MLDHGFRRWLRGVFSFRVYVTRGDDFQAGFEIGWFWLVAALLLVLWGSAP